MLDRARRIIATIEDALLAVLLVAMIVLAVAQIILRNFANAGITWSDPVLRLGVLWLALLGAMAATREGRHINIDILGNFAPPRVRAPIRRLTDLFSAGVCGLIAWHAFRFVRGEWEAGTLVFGVVPTWLAQLIIPAGFALIALRFLINTIVPRPADPRPADPPPQEPRK